MNEVTLLLRDLADGQSQAGEKLFHLIYDELRRIAVAQMARERTGHTLQPTALVHEAYIRFLGGASPARFENRRHFFSVAADAMRRILVESARRRKRLKRGSGRPPLALDEALLSVDGPQDDILAINEALDKFAAKNPRAAELVKLHFFAGLSIEDAAEAMGIAARTAYNKWDYAKAWLYRELKGTGAAQ
jgi:RNA polymerase sigma factor (TIGR02999 family)